MADWLSRLIEGYSAGTGVKIIGDPSGAADDADAAIALKGLAAGSARQSDGLALAAADGDPLPDTLRVIAVVKHASAPTAGGTHNLYVGAQAKGPTTARWPGGLTGSDAAYTLTSNRPRFIGSLVMPSTTDVQVAEFVVRTPGRLLAFVWENAASTAIENETATPYGLIIVPLTWRHSEVA